MGRVVRGVTGRQIRVLEEAMASVEKPAVWLIAPAHGRLQLSEVTMGQWATLTVPGIDIRVVVVADDENLDLARGYGFDVLERPNYELGRRYNDGFQYAYEHGADFAADAGTRNLIHPDLLAAIPWDDRFHSGNLYSLVRGDISVFDCRNVFGRGPLFIPRRILAVFPRPTDEDARQLILHTACTRIQTRFPLDIRFTNVHDFQYVGLTSPDDSGRVTRFEDYENRWGIERTHPLESLGDWYGATVQAQVAAL